MRLALVFSLLLAFAAWRPAPGAPPGDAQADDAPRFRTTRTSPVELPLPDEDDAFTFAVYGDRTGGPASGVAILAQAVEETNVLGPDLVMTVGDLIQGYNERPAWMVEMAQFKAIMDRLDMPWFPVAGNHDVYGSTGGRTPPNHEDDYEEHFGPLWYAFRHKDAWFVSLYTDEGDPATGRKSFGDPACQRMSDEQVAFLTDTLEAARDAEHVFVFLHHPRWLGGGYGDDWERIHRLLADAGNVSAVFAGHIHRMRYDGERDGIEYFTLATVGGSQAGDLPEAGWLHHYFHVTVRGDGVDVASLPVGSTDDPRKVTGEIGDRARRATRELRPVFLSQASLASNLAVAGQLEVEVANPISDPLDLTILAEPGDRSWVVSPEHQHVVLAPGAAHRFTLEIARGPEPLGPDFDLPRVVLRADHLAPNLRIPLPDRREPVPFAVTSLPRPAPPGPGDPEQVLTLDGSDDCAAIPSALLALPADAPFTLECWVRMDERRPTQGLVAKTESSEYGLFLQDGKPALYVHLDGEYAAAEAPEPLERGRWTHVAGQFDGEAVEVFVDGRSVVRLGASGTRTPNDLPLLVGADVQAGGAGGSFLRGAVDEVRLSKGARYADGATPERRLASDAETLLLLHFDGAVGPWVFDDSTGRAHATLRGAARVRGE